MKLALEGIRIIDLTDYMAGPWSTMLLASCGAEVIRVESRLHFGFRRSAPWGNIGSGPDPVSQDDMLKFSVSPIFTQFNRNKLSVSLNMSKPEGRELVKQLIKKSDVIVDNFRPGILQKWGLDYLSLKEIKSDIIAVSLQPMGTTGPYRNWTTWGMNLMSFSGCTYEWGYPDALEPVGSQGQHIDYIVASMAANAVLAALHYRKRTGKGQYIDVTQIALMASVMGTIFLDYFVNNRNSLPRGNRHPQFAPYDCYRCLGDDSWCVIAVRSEEEWRRFCDAIEQPPWTVDPKFKDMESRLKNADELTKNVEKWTVQYTPHQVMKILQSFGVAAGAVQNNEDLYSDIQLRASKFIDEHDTPRFGKVTYSGVPLHFSKTPIAPLKKAPIFGEHNEYVYQDLLGFSKEEIKKLVEDEIIY